MGAREAGQACGANPKISICSRPAVAVARKAAAPLEQPASSQQHGELSPAATVARLGASGSGSLP